MCSSGDDQGVVNRMAQSSLLLKGWNVVLVSALPAFAAAGENWSFTWYPCGLSHSGALTPASQGHFAGGSPFLSHNHRYVNLLRNGCLRPLKAVHRRQMTNNETLLPYDRQENPSPGCDIGSLSKGCGTDSGATTCGPAVSPFRTRRGSPSDRSRHGDGAAFKASVRQSLESGWSPWPARLSSASGLGILRIPASWHPSTRRQGRLREFR